MQPNPFQPLPESVEIGGGSYPINSDFRMGVAIETEILAGDKPDVLGLLSTFYCEAIPQDVEAAVDRMVWFYSCAPDEGQTGDKKGGRHYDFEIDKDALLASFLSAYGIDLTTAPLHWWAFRRLMLNLPPDTPFMERVKYRCADLKKLSKEERKHYKKMQALYAIKKHPEKPHMTVEERDAALREKIRRRYEEAQKHREESQ